MFDVLGKQTAELLNLACRQGQTIFRAKYAPSGVLA
jgi:hypothetical protein